MKGQDRVALQCTQGFPYWIVRCPETPQKRDTRLKNEIGMNLGKKFLPLLMYIYICLHPINTLHSYRIGVSMSALVYRTEPHEWPFKLQKWAFGTLEPKGLELVRLDARKTFSYPKIKDPPSVNILPYS